MANSAISQATSTRPILAHMRNDSGDFAPAPGGRSSVYSRSQATLDSSNVSLSINYLPSKFSVPLAKVGLRKRKGDTAEPELPKQGGGMNVFREGEARMPSGGTGKSMRWTRFKWILFGTNLLVRK